RGFIPVGAPPSVRTGASTLFAPGAGAPTTVSLLQEHRPRCEPEPAHFRTRRGCSYRGFVPVGAPPSVRTGASTFSHPGRVLLPRFRSCRSTALGANRSQHIFAPD